MMAFLFLLLLFAIILAMRNQRQQALIVFAVAFALSAFWFNHHVGQSLTIVL